MSVDPLGVPQTTLDRAAHRRGDPELPERLLASPDTRVLVLCGDRGPVVDRDGQPELALVPPAEWQAAGLLAYLGVDPSTSREHLLAAFGAAPAGDEPRLSVPAPVLPGTSTTAGTEPEVHWAGLRELAPRLDPLGADLLTTGVALANWHAVTTHCPRCGAATEVTQTGWVRACPGCGAEQYPRTDPAVIMMVTDPDDRLLLGRHSRWQRGHYSTLAGFVEPGESAEDAVRREVFEEAGVQVGEVQYLTSQPWPFPASLMLGFHAHALSSEIRVDGVELVEAHWWSREDVAIDLASGDLLLPPRLSVARQMIERWYGKPITRSANAWN